MPLQHKIRPFKFKDFPSLVRLLGEEWNLGRRQSQTPGDICVWLYALEIVAEAAKLYCFEQGKSAVGFVGYTAYRQPRGWRNYFCRLLFILLFHHPRIKYPDKLREYYNYYEYIPESEKCQGNCSLTIFIVDERFRGMNIGRRLFEYLLIKAGHHGLKKLLIETDDSCNVGFYEKSGCRKISEMGTYDEQGLENFSQKAYLYEKKI